MAIDPCSEASDLIHSSGKIFLRLLLLSLYLMLTLKAKLKITTKTN